MNAPIQSAQYNRDQNAGIVPPPKKTGQSVPPISKIPFIPNTPLPAALMTKEFPPALPPPTSDNKSKSAQAPVQPKQISTSIVTTVPATAIKTAPASLAPATVMPDENVLLGEQLTAQCHIAANAMPEVIKAGGIMMNIKGTLFAREQGSGNGKSGDGLKAWLTRFAPRINRGSAYRYMHVAEAVAAKFILPQGVSFAELVTKPADALPEDHRAKQQELWAFVDGTSQRSWLDMFTPRKQGVDGCLKNKPPTDGKDSKDLKNRNRLDKLKVSDLASRFTGENAYDDWSDEELEQAAEIFTTALARIGKSLLLRKKNGELHSTQDGVGMRKDK